MMSEFLKSNRVPAPEVCGRGAWAQATATKILLGSGNPAEGLLQHFGRFVRDFVDRCGIEPPFHLVAIGANGSVNVALASETDVERICSCPIVTGLAPPIVVTMVRPDGRFKTAKIEIERPTALQ
jgi:hypothetical protein